MIRLATERLFSTGGVRIAAPNCFYYATTSQQPLKSSPNYIKDSEEWDTMRGRESGWENAT